MSNVTLYSQPGCGPCIAVKGRLRAHNVPFTEVNVREDAEAQEWMAERGFKQTPVLRHGHAAITGPTEMLDFARNWGEREAT